METIQISITDLQIEQKEVLIAQLIEAGFEGFEEDDHLLKAYINADLFDAGSFDTFIKEKGINFTQTVIKETNWNEAWERGFQPIMVQSEASLPPFVYIRAPFHVQLPHATHDIIITPKMSFGTGHHATTYMMMEQMSHLNFTDKSIIDFGTGTGLLAILSEKMGAKQILAIDCDDWSILNAHENIAINHCEKINIVKEEVCVQKGFKADILLANINLNIIKNNLEAIINCCEEKTTILFSGMLVENENEITSLLHSYEILTDQVFYKDNWLLIVAKKGE